MERLIDLLFSFYGPAPYFIIFGVLLACGLGLPIPEDVTLFAAGVAAYYGVVSLPVIIVVSYVGVMVGDGLMFFLGAKYGRRLTKKWFFHKLLPDERLDAMSQRLKKRGNSLIFFARFMPGLRAPIFFSAGVLHLPARVFILYDGMAALLSVPAIIGAIYYFGDEMDWVLRRIQQIEHGLVFGIFGVLFFVIAKFAIQTRRSKKKV